MTTASMRVERSIAKLRERGGRRIPVALQPDAAAALEALLAAGYARSRAGVIAAALLDAQRKLVRTLQK